MPLRLREVIEVIALATLLGCTIVLIGIWLAAAGSGNSLTVTVNEYGERTPELLLWVVTVPIIAVWLHRRLRTQ